MPAHSDTLRQLILLKFMNTPSAYFRHLFPLFFTRGNKRGSTFSAYPPLFALCSGLIATGVATTACAEATASSQLHAALSAHYEAERTAMAAREGWRNLKHTAQHTPLTSAQGLPACANELQLQPAASAQTGRQLVTVTCPSPHWTLKVSSEIRYTLPVIKSQRVIERGETLTRDALKQEETDITRQRRGFFHQVDDVEGLSAKRRLRPNQLLTPELVDAPLMVKRGDGVKIIANKDGIAASMSGEALANGAKNDVIRVKNVTSNKIIDAKVIDNGIVTSTF